MLNDSNTIHDIGIAQAVLAGGESERVQVPECSVAPENKEATESQSNSQSSVNGSNETRSVPRLENLEIATIVRDPRLQSRVQMNGATVEEYREDKRNGAVLPPVTIIIVDGKSYLVEGWHRIEAAILEGETHILANVQDGTWKDAVLVSAKANSTHGLRRSNADKIRAAEMVFTLPECVLMSDRDISRLIGVSQPTVSAVRHRLESESVIPRSAVRKGTDGRTINTAKIGRTKKNAKRASSRGRDNTVPVEVSGSERPDEIVDAGYERVQSAVGGNSCSPSEVSCKEETDNTADVIYDSELSAITAEEAWPAPSTPIEGKMDELSASEPIPTPVSEIAETDAPSDLDLLPKDENVVTPDHPEPAAVEISEPPEMIIARLQQEIAEKDARIKELEQDLQYAYLECERLRALIPNDEEDER